MKTLFPAAVGNVKVHHIDIFFLGLLFQLLAYVRHNSTYFIGYLNGVDFFLLGIILRFGD